MPIDREVSRPELSPADSLDFAPLFIIDHSKLTSNGLLATLEAKRLFQAATTTGFFYLDLQSHHCSDEGTASSTQDGKILKEVDELFTLMRKFFDLSIDEKSKYDMANYGGYFGYVPSNFLTTVTQFCNLKC